ncbi:VOC family protein [Marasmitruncus massiliensis]|uniref:VOC family protein n=1 Tax=Marasmitruncus massiliensis TaxID=1944642 RepID=UPI000C79D68C|nr:VOC family protein [Marasmitruncus massiliensis]
MTVSSLLTGLQHIGIPTNNLDRTADFYHALGFESVLEAVNEAAHERVAFLKLGNLMIETYENHCAVGRAGAIDHIALDVNDIESAFSMTKAAGLKLLDTEIQSLPFWERGVRFFTVEGPNMEKVEFCQKL